MTLREMLARVFGEAGSAPVETELRPSEVIEQARRRWRVGLVWRTVSAAGAAAVIVTGVAIAPGLTPAPDRDPAPVATGRPSPVPTTAPASSPPAATPSHTPTKPEPTPEPPAPSEETEPEPTPEKRTPPPREPRRPPPPQPEETPTTAPALGWGASAESGEGTATADEPAQLTGVRVGQHRLFDRVVFDFASAKLPEYDVRYVADGELRSPGSGRPVEMEGEYDLEITFRETTNAGIDDNPRTPGYPAVREARYLGGYEQVHTAAVGVDGDGEEKPGFRILIVDDPSRIVVDVAH